ncbi:MAG: MATE family efflux transporter [Methermicoccaceae archaeon]
MNHATNYERKNRGIEGIEMSSENTNNPALTVGSIHKNLWKLAFPMIIGNVLEVAFEMFDLFFVGKLGPEAIAAVSLAGSVMFVIIAGVVGISVGTTAMISRFIGAEDREGATRVANQSLILGLIVSLIITAFGLLGSEPLLRLIGAEGDVLTLAMDYITVLFVGMVTMILFYLANGIMQGAGDARTPLKLLATSNTINIVLDPLLIFGVGPFPEWGIVGAASASVIARGSCMLGALYLLASGATFVDITPRKMRLELDIVKKILRIGIPSSTSLLIRSSASLVFISIVAIHGTFAIATYGIGLRLDSVLLMPMFGIASATATLVGQNLGANEPMRAERTALFASHLSCLMAGVVAILFIIFAPQIISVFTKSEDVIAIGTLYLRIVSLSYLFVAYGSVLSMALNGAGDTMPPLIITVVSLYGCQVPLALVLPHFMGVGGLWTSIAIGSITYALIIYVVFKRGKWKQRKITMEYIKA